MICFGILPILAARKGFERGVAFGGCKPEAAMKASARAGFAAHRAST
jgi:hypothetical protein